MSGSIRTLTCILLLLSGIPAYADTILAQWTFEPDPFPVDSNNSTSGPIVLPSTGSGAMFGLHASAASDWSTPVGNGSANSYSVNTWTVGDYFHFQSSSLGFQGLKVSFDQASSGTGPRDFGFSYSTDGVTFIQFAVYAVLAMPPNWNTSTNQGAFAQSFDLSSVTALNNSANIFFRLIDLSTTASGGGTVGTAGTDRIDNFTITAVPLPPAYLAGIALLGLIPLARRKVMGTTAFCAV